MTCPTCNTPQPYDPEQQPRIFCISCESPVLPANQLMNCEDCGTVNKIGANTCLKCFSFKLVAVSDELPF